MMRFTVVEIGGPDKLVKLEDPHTAIIDQG